MIQYCKICLAIASITVVSNATHVQQLNVPLDYLV